MKRQEFLNPGESGKEIEEDGEGVSGEQKGSIDPEGFVFNITIKLVFIIKGKFF
ncbi:hypothetical protein [Leptospirillum ferriphilum]|uniref:hypothetical protein n=1 Tax=Leptospirillum ferriphilum TaxID=178606 RepID=UPI0015C2C82E|nr:hypothetical protein [Leptospirillum ferriphilum]